MPTYNTANLLKDLEQQTERFIQKAVSKYQMTPPEKLLRQPGENKWSAAQCIEHLNSYGRYYLPEIEKALKKAAKNNWSASEQFNAGLLGNYFTKLMISDRKGKKMRKMSAPKSHTPQVNLDSDKVISEFIEQQERLLALLVKARQVDLEKAKVSISIAKFIKLRLGDVFMFLIAHVHRHILQAEKALSLTLEKEKISSEEENTPVIFPR